MKTIYQDSKWLYAVCESKEHGSLIEVVLGGSGMWTAYYRLTEEDLREFERSGELLRLARDIAKNHSRYEDRRVRI